MSQTAIEALKTIMTVGDEQSRHIASEALLAMDGEKGRLMDALVSQAIQELKPHLENYESKTLTTPTGKPRSGIKAFCEEHGISESRVHKIFSGEVELTVDYAIRIAKGLKRWPGNPRYTVKDDFKVSRLKEALEFDKDSLLIFLFGLISD